jgi:hypothetical protein
MFILPNTDATVSKQHELTIDGKAYEWTGPYHYVMKEH